MSSEKYILVIPSKNVDQALINELKKFGLHQGIVSKVSDPVTSYEEVRFPVIEFIAKNENVFSILLNMIDVILINKLVNPKHENLIFDLIKKLDDKDKVDLYIELLKEKFPGTNFVVIFTDKNNMKIL
ncbi:hypothetical protein [Marinitoga lauensis]|uniref:hypothetical protein n=1 Tax=Marinitoga lauensis TaxID=2201189 RepID=UPI001012BE12|nr:hypothetical protein [Marinitoga lauensis]